MAANYVEILVKSRDTAKPDMDALKAKIADLSGQSATMRATVSDADAAAKLDALQAKLIELNKRVANPKISMQGAVRAESQIHAIEAQLAGLGGQAKQTGGSLSALGNALNILTLGLPKGWGEMGMLQKAITGVGIATGIGEPAVAGLTVAIGGLAGGLLSAGAATGVFGLVAKSVYGQVSSAMTAYSAAQAQLDKATTKKGRASALKAEAQAMSGLTASQKGLVTQISAVKNEWQGFVNAASPGVIGVMTQGLSMFPRVLSLVKPLLVPAEAGLTQLLSKLQGALWTKGPGDFVQVLAKNAEPAIVNIGTAIGNLAKGLGGIAKAFMPGAQQMLGGLDSLTAKFATWGDTLTSHSGFKSLESMARTDVPLLISALRSLGGIAKTTGSQMSSMSTFGNSKQFLELAGTVLKFADSLLKAHPGLVNLVLYAKMGSDSLGKMKTAFTGISGGIGSIKTAADNVSNLRKGLSDASAAADDATGAWGTFGGKLSSAGSAATSAMSAIGSGIGTAMSAVKTAVTGAITAIGEFGLGEKLAAAATKVWTAIQAAFDVVMDANPIMLVVIAIAALVAGVIYAYTHFKAFRDVVKDVMHAITTAIGAAVDWIKGHWKLLLGILIGPVGAAVLYIVTHWKQVTDGAKRMFDDVVGFFKSLPGKIVSAVGDLGHLLWNAGASIIHGLLAGLKSAYEDVKNFIGGIGSWIASHKGPITVDAVLLRPHGRAIMGGLVGGLQDGMPGLNAQLARTTSSIQGGIRPGGGRGGQPLVIRIELAGNADLGRAVMKSIRVMGGDPRIVQRKVVLAP